MRRSKRSRKSYAEDKKLVHDLLGLHVHDAPGNGSNCGFMALGRGMKMDPDAVKSLIVDHTTDISRVAQLHTSTVWLDSNDMVALSKSGVRILCVQVTKNVITSQADLIATLYSGGKEVAIHFSERIKEVLRQEPNAIVIMNVFRTHFMAIDRM